MLQSESPGQCLKLSLISLTGIATHDITKRVAPVCSTKHMFACQLLLQRISSHTGGIVIEASYITVHSRISLLLILSSNSIITKISYSYCDITIAYYIFWLDKIVHWSPSQNRDMWFKLPPQWSHLVSYPF